MGKHFYELSAKHIHFISARKLFFVGMLMALVFLTLFSKSASPTSILAYVLLLAGGLGNLINRLIYGGYVVDFINIGIGPIRTGVFNVADVVVIAGALMLFTGMPRANKRLSER
ncbi:MAG: hypothetical protein CTY19_14280 [Methylomonas sp.]|nr:MAG: hypothetical protein CTY19_14280 [Methylomonas sp.]